MTVLCLSLRSEGFAMYMTQEYCHVPIEAGVTIMGTPVVDSADRYVQVKSSSTSQAIAEGALVDSLSDLVVSLSTPPGVRPSTNVVLEVRSQHVQFVDGACGGKRSLKTGNLELKSLDQEPLPADFQHINVTIVAAWATSYSSGVKKTSDYSFRLSLNPNSMAEL